MSGSTLPLAPDAFSGRKLGKYEVLCRLSTGGMAEIFLASQRGLAGFHKLVVLKQILPDIRGEEEFVRMFLDEAKVSAAFNHPNIAQVFDLDIDDGELFLAMEFVPGATLVEVAKACRAASEPIPLGFSLAATRDAALALHYAHTFTDPLGRPASIIHRDVAEKNIMVTYEGVTKLLDFGIAKHLARKSRTQIGMVKGTSGYMSPEQILGEPLDARSDLFSLGVVLHECLTGMRLFHARTPSQGAGAVLQGHVPPPSRTNREVPPELDAIVLKALARRRDDRYASTLEFARALERAVGPLIWHPEQSGEVIRRLFDERREQTRQLLMADRLMSGELTDEVRLSQIFSLDSQQQPPDLPEEPGTQPGLPQLTPALPSRASSSSEQTVQHEVKPPPPPPPEPQARPPTPPRGASTRAAPPGVAPAEPAAIRRAVFEPLPQKRASGTPQPSPELILPPPPPPEALGRTRAAEEPARTRPPTWVDENATRAAPPEEPPRPEPRQRPSGVDLHSMGTIPWTEAPPGLQRSPAPEEERTASNPNARAQGYHEPTPPPEEEYSQDESVTRPIRALQVEAETDAEAEEPVADTNETLLPEDDTSRATIPGTPSVESGRRGWLLVVLAAGVLLAGGGAMTVALGLDGGRPMALLDDPAQDVRPAPPAQAPTPSPAPAPASPSPGAPAPDTTTALQPEAVAPAAPPGTEGGVELPPPPSQEPGAVKAAVEEEPAPPARKLRSPTRRTRNPQKPLAEGSAVGGPVSGEPSPAPAPGGAGTLTLVTEPYAKVYLGRRLLGSTPLFKVSLPSGRHSLRLTDPSGQSLRLAVEIRPGETTALRVGLDTLAQE